MDIETTKALRALHKKSLRFSFAAWLFVSFAVITFFNDHFFKLGNMAIETIWGFDIPENAYVFSLLIAIFLKIEAMHIFQSWVYDTKRLSKVFSD